MPLKHTCLNKKKIKRSTKNRANMMLLPLVCLSILSLLTCSDSRQYKHEKQTIYEALKAHGLPMGLLPKGVKEFDIDENGRFQVHLDQACNAKFENELHYEMNVSGTLSYGQIGDLSGVSAQDLFLWFQVKGIRVDIPSSGLIYFDVGVVFKQFSLSLFETPPDCISVRTVDPGEIQDRKHIAEVMSKSRSGKLRYQLDQ